MKLLSVNSAVREIVYNLNVLDGDNYSLTQAVEQTLNSVYFSGGQAVEALEQFVQAESLGKLFYVMNDLKEFQRAEHGLIITDFADRESVANSFYERIIISVHDYLESLNAENNSELIEHCNRLLSNEFNDDVADFDNIEYITVNDDYVEGDDEL